MLCRWEKDAGLLGQALGEADFVLVRCWFLRLPFAAELYFSFNCWQTTCLTCMLPQCLRYLPPHHLLVYTEYSTFFIRDREVRSRCIASIERYCTEYEYMARPHHVHYSTIRTCTRTYAHESQGKEHCMELGCEPECPRLIQGKQQEPN